MIRKHLPQQRKNALVGKDRLPWRLDPSRRRVCQPRAERILEHPFPGIEFERELDCAVVEIDKTAVVAQSDILDIDQCGCEPGLPCGVLEIGQRAGILDISGASGQMKVASLAELSPCIDQALMDR